ncbi:MAG: hypothetical protein N2515_11350, partial [Deltaproteobacteria bacterium]|nr:hypothetical protein [Deltaproteobacteria bacterium]
MIHLARLLIVISSLFLARPLWEGGWRYYLDHSAHIAETIDLGRNSSGWSDLAFAGFPLGFLHSPLWYGIAARLVALGVPGWVNHLFWTVFGHAVIGLCALEVARRLAPLPVALLAAWLAQNQSLLITGPSGVFSGMWTFGISIGLVLLLFKELHAPLGWAALPKLALLIGLIGLTHT